MIDLIETLMPKASRTTAGPAARNTELHAECLEQRLVPADLVGAIGDIAPAAPHPGEQISVSWQITNWDSDYVGVGFEVDWLVSRDPYPSLDDPFLSYQYLPPGFPPFYNYSGSANLYLPGSGDPFWSGGGNRYLIMAVDGSNTVWEWNESNNNTSAFLPVGGDSSGSLGRLADLPKTGVPRGQVLSAVITQLQARLREAATAQAEMRTQLRKIGVAVPAWNADLKNLANNIAAIGVKLQPLISGKVKSLKIGGSVFTRSDLDLTERYLKYVFVHDNASARLSPATATTHAGLLDDPKQYIKDITGYSKLEKWADETNKRISGFVEDLKKAPSKFFKWVNGLFGNAGESQARAKQQARAVSEGGPAFTDRVNEIERELAQSAEDKLAELDSLLDGAPGIFGIAGYRLKSSILKARDSAHMLDEQSVSIETWVRNRGLLGKWAGTLSRGGLSGSIDLYFKPSSAAANTVSGVIGHTFYNGGDTSRTSGNFTGRLDADNVFRGRATIHNASGSGSYDIAWIFTGNRLRGTLYNGTTIHFQANKK